MIEQSPAARRARGLYPEIEPHGGGRLPVGDGHVIHWEECGRTDGYPALFLHGGPGSGCSPRARRWFDPERYRIILFDQRGCGQSTPHASDPAIDLSTNTTMHLLADIERLRRHLGVERWLVLGHSWGCTLALAYAQAHPGRVGGLVLVGVTMTRQREIDWLYRGLAPLFPEEWERFRAGVPAPLQDGDLVEAYHHLLMDADPAVRARAAQDWHQWEAATISVTPGASPPSRWADADYRLARARIITHYFRHRAWLEEGALLRDASRLNGIRGAMIQGRLDLEAPLVTAWDLSRVWTTAELIVVGGAGHSPGDHGMAEAIVAATDRLALDA